MNKQKPKKNICIDIIDKMSLIYKEFLYIDKKRSTMQFIEKIYMKIHRNIFNFSHSKRNANRNDNDIVFPI